MANMKQPKNIELERKKASHIFSYLMERKNENQYSDPFDLLKDMNDVIRIYEPEKIA